MSVPEAQLAPHLRELFQQRRATHSTSHPQTSWGAGGRPKLKGGEAALVFRTSCKVQREARTHDPVFQMGVRLQPSDVGAVKHAKESGICTWRLLPARD